MGLAGLLDKPVRTEPSQVEEAIEQVFSHPDYSESVPPITAPQSAIDTIRRFFRGIADFFEGINEWMRALHVASPFLFWLIIAGLVAVLFVLILHITYSVRMTLSALKGGPADAEEAERIRKRRFRDLRAEAHEQAGEGDFGGAVRKLLLAIFARFEDTRRGEVPEGWTNHEVVERMQADELDRERLSDLAFAVDRVWYGRQRATQSDYEDAARIVDSLARG